MVEEIRDVTWGLWGEQLSHEQTIQRIINAGFPVKGGVALTMFAIVEGESGEYQRAWHANVVRKDDGTIVRYNLMGDPDINGKYMKIKSIDLGFMQFNIAVEPYALIEMTVEAMEVFVETKFDERPDLADPVESALAAYQLYLRRGFQPWYAYKPGTIEFWRKKRYGAKAFANWHLHAFVGVRDRETNKPLNLEFK